MRGGEGTAHGHRRRQGRGGTHPKKMTKKQSSARIILYRMMTRCAWRKESEGLTRKTTIHLQSRARVHA